MAWKYPFWPTAHSTTTRRSLARQSKAKWSGSASSDPNVATRHIPIAEQEVDVVRLQRLYRDVVLWIWRRGKESIGSASLSSSAMISLEDTATRHLSAHGSGRCIDNDIMY